MSDENLSYQRGELRGDFSRDCFDPRKHYSAVMMQQGRVLLDADWNEQTSIVLHHLRRLAADLIGHHGGPGKGFMVEPCFVGESRSRKQDFSIHEGHYYVEGILCENEQRMPYSQHRGLSFVEFEPLSSGIHLVYLDVWERQVTLIQDSTLGEVALGGLDGATRSMVVWQVKTKPLSIALKAAANKARDYEKFLSLLCIERASGRLKVRTEPTGGYSGLENQLYRVEIHAPGTSQHASFKWSRDNSSVAFAIRGLASSGAVTTVTVAHLRPDAQSALAVGDWVEIVDDDYTLQNRAEPLLQVRAIDPEANQIELSGAHTTATGQDPRKHPLLRRWDQRQTARSKPGASGVAIAESRNDWVELENGVEIQFQSSRDGKPNRYRTGDYWLIPARAGAGGLGQPQPLGPHGIRHHYAPLAVIAVARNGKVTVMDVRRKFAR